MKTEEMIEQLRQGDRSILRETKEQGVQNILDQVTEDQINDAVNMLRRDPDFAVFFATTLGAIITSVAEGVMTGTLNEQLDEVNYAAMGYTGIVYSLAKNGYPKQEN